MTSMKKTWSRFLSLLLTVMMVVSCLPLTVLAADASAHYLGLDDGGWIDSAEPQAVQLYHADGSSVQEITSGEKYGIVCNKKMMSSSYTVGSNQVVYRTDFVSGNLAKAAYQFTFTKADSGYTIGANKPGYYLTCEVVDATYPNKDSCTTYVLSQEAEIFNIAPVDGTPGSYHIWAGEAAPPEAPAAKAQLGTDANYDGDVVELSNALYTFAKNGDVYTVSNGGAYLNIVPGKNPYPNGTDSSAVVKVEMAGGKFFLSNNSGRYLAFVAANRFDGGNAASCENLSALFAFDMFRPAAKGEASSEEIAGYVRLTGVEEVEDGGRYLIAHANGDTWYVLYPSDSTTDAYAHVAKVVAPGTESPEPSEPVEPSEPSEPPKPVSGSDISKMLDGSPDNTWVFTGGAAVEGGFDQTDGQRNYMGHFEESVRWSGTATEGENNGAGLGFSTGRQRYTVNTAKSGQTLNDVVSNWDSAVARYNPRAVVYMVGQEDANSETFSADLKSFVDKSLALRNGKGFAVIQKSWDGSLTNLDAAVDAVVEGYADTDAYARIAVVKHTGVSALDAAGHLAIANQLLKALFNRSGLSSQKLTEAVRPSEYVETAPAVTLEDGVMTIALAGGFTYELRLDNGVTISGSGKDSASVADLPEGEGYTLITRSADGSTQYKTLSSAAPSLNAVQSKVAALVEEDRSLTWLFMGDSITHGAAHTVGYDSIAQLFDKYLDMLGRPGDVVVNTAVSSADSAGTLRAIQYRMAQFGAPDVVSIMLGTNDASTIKDTAAYKRNLESIIAEIRKVNPDAVIILRSPTAVITTESNVRYNCGEKYGAMMKEIADADPENIIYMDQYSAMQEALGTYTWMKAGNPKALMSDWLHPGALGHVVMTRNFIKAIGLWTEDTAISNLDYVITTPETSATSVKTGLVVNGQTITLAPSALGGNLGQTTLSAAGRDGRTWSVTAAPGESLSLTLPEGAYTVSAVSVRTDVAKEVAFASANVEIGEVAYEKPAAPANQPEEGTYTMPDDKLSGTGSSEPMSDADVSSYFRIPALVTLPNGWIVAASDARWPNTNDSPNNLDTIVSVSKDGGETWDWEIINYFADFAPVQGPTYYPGTSKFASASFIDPALTVDGSGKVWMLVDMLPSYGGNAGGNKMGPANTGFDEQGRLLLTHGVAGGTASTNANDYTYCVDLNAQPSATVQKDGQSVGLYPIRDRANGMETGYYVDIFMDLWYDYEDGGMKPVLCRQTDSTHYVQNNIFYMQSEWKVFCTFYIMVRSAEVDEANGCLVWSEPRLLNVKNTGERFTAVCPGRGTTTTVTVDGKQTERVIFALYDNATGTELASTVYSDDGGKTWTRGARTPDVSTNGTGKSSESQFIHLPNGDLRLYSRNSVGYISYADSSDGGKTWGVSKLDNNLGYCGNCMVSFINLEGKLVDPDNTVYENLILASYPKASYRSSGVIRIGSINPETNEVTWLNGDAIRFPGRYNYSCLTQYLGEDGKPADMFAVLYEQDDTSNPAKGVMAMRYVELTAADLLGDGWVLVNEVPEPVTLTVDNSLVDIVAGESQTVDIEYSPADAEVVWTSSDESVATVSADGVITGVSAGKAVVTVAVTKGSLTRSASINVLIQGADGSIILPDQYLSGLTSVTIPGSTSYVLDEDGVEDGVYIIYAQSGDRVMHNNHKKGATDHCRPNMSGDKAMNANHAADTWKPTDDVWKLVEQEDGSYFIQSLTDGKYLTATASGSQLALGDEGVPFTITHLGNGVYNVKNGDNYLAFSGGWKIQDSAFEIRLFGEQTTQDVTTYTVTADGLKALIRSLDQYEANYSHILDLAGEYDDEAEALAAQAAIDEASKTLYAQLRTGNTTRYTVTYEVNGELWGVQSYYAGNTIVPMTRPAAPAGQVFAGWTGLPTDRIMPDHDLALVASFRASGGTTDPVPVVPEIVIPPTEEIEDPDTPLAELPFIDVDHEKWYAQSIANVVAKGLMEGVETLLFAPEDAMTRGMTAQALYALAQKPEVTDPASFLDLADGVNYADAVAWGAETGVIKGYSETEFGGEDILNRQQLATLLYRYAQLIDKQNVTADTGVLGQFSDHARVSAWAKDAMAWAVANELVIGRTDGTLDPRATITRAEAAAILDRYSKLFTA